MPHSSIFFFLLHDSWDSTRTGTREEICLAQITRPNIEKMPTHLQKTLKTEQKDTKFQNFGVENTANLQNNNNKHVVG